VHILKPKNTAQGDTTNNIVPRVAGSAGYNNFIIGPARAANPNVAGKVTKSIVLNLS